MNFITAFKLILAHYSEIVAAVAVAESFFPQGGAGAQKLDLVKTTLQSNADLASSLQAGDFEALWPYLVKVIALIVKMATKA